MRVSLGICEGCLLISLLTDRKKKAINTKNIDRSQAIVTLLGKEHFIWRGGGRGEAEQFLPFFSAALICGIFFFRDNCTSIHIGLLSQPTPHMFS